MFLEWNMGYFPCILLHTHISLTYMRNIEQLHDRVRKSRISQGLSQAELAERTGVSQPTVANWESGSHTPRRAALERIGQALNVEPIWLLSGDAGQASDAALTYLGNPIYHIPIYQWREDGPVIDPDNTIGFLPFPAKHGKYIALRKRVSNSAAQHIRIIDPEIQVSPVGPDDRYTSVDSWDISSSDAAQGKSEILGRVIADMTIYSDSSK